MVLISIPQEAFAFPVYVHNSYSQPMSVATLNFEDNENEFYCRGWFNLGMSFHIRGMGANSGIGGRHDSWEPTQ